MTASVGRNARLIDRLIREGADIAICLEVGKYNDTSIAVSHRLIGFQAAAMIAALRRLADRLEEQLAETLAEKNPS